MLPTTDPNAGAASAWSNGQYSNPQAAQPHASLLERLLPTGLSILGGAIGTLADPIIGPAGTLGGAALGSSAGQQLENNLTGSKGSTLTAGLEGLAGQGIGMGAAKVLGGAADAGANWLAGRAGNEAEAAYTAPFKGIENTAIAKSSDLNGTASLMKDLDVAGTPQAWQDAASVATGRRGLGAATGALDSIVSNAGQLPSNGLLSRVSSALQNAGADTGDKSVSWLTKDLGNATSEGTIGTDGKMLAGPVTKANAAGASAIEQVDPTALMNTLQKLDGRIAAYHNPNVQLSVNDGATLQGLQNAKGEIEDTLYGSGIDNAVAAHTVDPETAQKILDAAGGNQKLADYIINGINNAKTGAELRAMQAPLVQASKLGNAAAFQASGQLPGTLEGQTAKLIDQSTGDVIPGAVQTVASVAHPGLGTALKLGSALGSTGVKLGATAAGKVPDSLLNVLGQIAAHSPSLGNDSSSQASATTQGAPSAIVGDNVMNPYQTATPQQTPITAGDIRAAGVFAPQTVDLLGQLLQREQQSSAGSDLLHGAESAYGAAGGGQGMGSGLLGELSSFVPGTSAYQYNAQKAALAASLSKATGIDAHSILAMLPGLMTSPGAAQQDFGSLQQANDRFNLQNGPSMLSSLPVTAAQ